MENKENYITLNNGHKMPLFGIGTYLMENIEENVYLSIKNGVRLIDTALMYNNETDVGKGIKRAIEEKVVERKDLFIVTKLWMTHFDKVQDTFKEQLKNLNLDYVDLYLIHWPKRVITEKNGIYEVDKTPTHKIWYEMEELVRKGLVKSIGVSNFNCQLLLDLFTYCEIKPVINEIELQPYYQRKNLIEFCKKFEVNIIAYGSLVLGVYAKKKNDFVKYNLLQEKEIIALAKKYNKSEAQIALNWAISQNVVVIPKSSSIKRIIENLDSVKFRLSKEDMELLKKLDENKRFCNEIDKIQNFGLYDNFA